MSTVNNAGECWLQTKKNTNSMQQFFWVKEAREGTQF